MLSGSARAIGLICIMGLSWPVLAATPEEVDKSIKRGVAWLYTQQNEQGNWESTPGPGRDARKEQADPKSGQWGGFSAIATYALLDAGESWTDKRVQKACDWLNKAPMIGTYAIALRAQCWQYLPQNANVKTAAQRDCGMLLNGMKGRGEARGMWGYFVSDAASPRYDHSTSQIALLGVWASNQAGREVPAAFWKEAENAWRGHQNEDGGWAYLYKGDGEQGQSKLSMTLAGVATLFIAQDYVHINDGLYCKGNVFDGHLIAGTKWIKEHINEGFGGGYVLYGAERVGLASGYKYFGDFDWYAQAADKLVHGQGQDGSWGSVPETAFAVIVLSRGRAPVILNKFEYELEGKPPVTARAVPKPAPKVEPAPAARPNANPRVNPRQQQQPAKPAPEPKPVFPVPAPEIDPNANAYPANWCERPRDVALFTRWMTDMTERKLNWQIISSKNSVDDFHDAPVLYMSGNQKLVLPKETIDKLRQYIEEGGLLFGQADCGNKAFTDSFIELGKQLFPMYEFRELPADHPIYSRQQFLRKNWKNPPSVIGLSNGVRELMITLPGSDIARNWQQGEYKGKEESFQVMNGIILYAVDRQNLRYRGGTHIVRLPEAAAPAGGREIKVARLEFAGNWNPEPAGWRRIAAIIQKQQQANVTVAPIKLGEGKLDESIYPIAHLTGTGGFTFTKDQLNEIRKYLIKGGTVICDAAGGNSEFAASAEKELLQIITGSKLELIPAEDPALADTKGAGNIEGPMIAPPPIAIPGSDAATQPAATQPAGKSLFPEATAATTQATAKTAAHGVLPGNFPIDYRAFARSRIGTTENLRLKGIKFRRKWAVVFSVEDLTAGMVGQPVDGIYGYTPACATEIMRRLVLNLAPAAAAPAAGQPPAGQ